MRNVGGNDGFILHAVQQERLRLILIDGQQGGLGLGSFGLGGFVNGGLQSRLESRFRRFRPSEHASKLIPVSRFAAGVKLAQRGLGDFGILLGHGGEKLGQNRHIFPLGSN